MRMEEQSKSLNKIMNSFNVSDQNRLKQWWRKKMILAFILAGLSSGLGFFIGLGYGLFSAGNLK